MQHTLLSLQAAAASGEADAQFQLAMAMAREGAVERALIWLRRAELQGHVAAKRERALMAIFRIAGDTDYSDGLRLLAESADAGDAAANYWLAALAPQTGANWDADAALVRLRVAATAGDALALRNCGLIAAANAADANAVRLFSAALAQGDGHSRTLLAQLPPSAGDSNEDSDLAAALPAHWPTPPVATAHVHCADPYIATIDDIFSPLDCAHVIELGRQHLKPSLTVDPADGRAVRNQLRTSSSMEFDIFQEDFWLRVLQARLCDRFGVPLQRAEPLSLLRYEPGEQYHPHRDYLHPSSLDSPEGRRCGQRLYTVFVYLNKVEAGGETVFPDMGIRVAPQRGRAVLFHNTLRGGEPDPRTLHAGLPVERGEKWLGTLWLRERPVRTG